MRRWFADEAFEGKRTERRALAPDD